MPARPKTVLFALLLVLLIQAGWAEKIADIQPQGYVTDLAQVIDPATRQKIELLGTEVQQKTGAQIAVVTVNSLEGQSREDYAADLYKHLGIGAKGKDNGVLILIAPKDRQYKIEVGYGLEPVINDARAGDVGRDMVPDLRKGDFSAAALTGVTGVAQFIAADAGVQLTGFRSGRQVRRPEKHPGGCLCHLWGILPADSGAGARGARAADAVLAAEEWAARCRGSCWATEWDAAVAAGAAGSVAAPAAGAAVVVEDLADSAAA